MHEVDAVRGEARRDLDAVLLHVEDEREEALELRWRDVVPVRSLDERLSQGVGSIEDRVSRGGGLESSRELGWPGHDRRTLPLRSRMATGRTAEDRVRRAPLQLRENELT